MVSSVKQNYKLRSEEWIEKSREERASRLDWVGVSIVKIFRES